MEQLCFREVDVERWADFAALFEDRGGPKSCWCMVWRASSTEGKCRDGASRRAQIKSRVDKGVPIGLLGYSGDRAVAWCSIAPRKTYRPFGGPPADLPIDRIGSLACFFIKRDQRGKGFTPQIIAAAVRHAKEHGATVVEAYPVDPESPSYRFMGFVETFASAGFREVARAGQRRHVMRLAV